MTDDQLATAIAALDEAGIVCRVYRADGQIRIEVPCAGAGKLAVQTRIRNALGRDVYLGHCNQRHDEYQYDLAPEPTPTEVPRIATAQWLAYSDTRSDLCPRDVPAAVLAYLGVNDMRAHFDVYPEPGNEGYAIRVCQNGWESSVPDPRA